MKFEGLAELQAALRNLPATLAGEAGKIVLGAADRAKSEIFYPLGSGLAEDLITINARASGFGARAVLKNKNKIASWYDKGTTARHTRLGKSRGIMPATHVFVRSVIRNRRIMYEELKQMLVDNGLSVRGDA